MYSYEFDRGSKRGTKNIFSTPNSLLATPYLLLPTCYSLLLTSYLLLPTFYYNQLPTKTYGAQYIGRLYSLVLSSFN